MILVSLTGAALAVAVQAEQKGLQGLADSRTAGRVAESTLISLNAGEMPIAAADEKIAVDVLKQADQSSRFVWVKVRAVVNHRSSELMGRVPRDIAERAARGLK
jgi:hypothetical protein